jgi:hypothetical protein
MLSIILAVGVLEVKSFWPQQAFVADVRRSVKACCDVVSRATSAGHAR